MEAKLAESTASSQRSEREYITLKESIQGMGEQWTKELDALKTDFKAREDEWKKQVEDSGLKYRTLTKLVQATQAERARIESLKAEKLKIDTEFEKSFREELSSLSEAIKESHLGSQESTKVAVHVQEELDRIHRLIRARGKEPSS